MKKLLFGLLVLSLSAATFAANPGTDSNANITVEAKLQVIAPTTDLVIEHFTKSGAWEPVVNVISFDHGGVIAATATPTTVPNSNLIEKFRIRRADGTILKTKTPTSTPDYTNISIKIGSDTNSVGSMIGAGAPISHTFKISQPAASTLEKTEAQFNIESEVKQIAANQVAGVYTRTETVTVALN